MSLGHFKSKKGEPFDWKAFQEHMGYSDQELADLKNNPQKSEYVQKICGSEVQDKYFVVEIVESHGCIAGLQPGDRLYFKGMSVLDTQKSDPWCPYIDDINHFISGMRSMVNQGLDPNKLYVNYSGCMDVGPENGLGRIVYKCFTINEDELDR